MPSLSAFLLFNPRTQEISLVWTYTLVNSTTIALLGELPGTQYVFDFCPGYWKIDNVPIFVINFVRSVVDSLGCKLYVGLPQ